MIILYLLRCIMLLSVFLDFTCNNFDFCCCSLCCRFFVRPQAELCLLPFHFQFVAIMVLIESASRELSNGGLLLSVLLILTVAVISRAVSIEFQAFWPLSKPIFD